MQDRLFDPGGAPERPKDLTPARPAPLRCDRVYRRVAPIVGVVLIVVAGALWLVDRSSSQRVPGSTATGGISGIDEELGAGRLAGLEQPGRRVGSVRRRLDPRPGPSGGAQWRGVDIRRGRLRGQGRRTCCKRPRPMTRATTHPTFIAASFCSTQRRGGRGRKRTQVVPRSWS